LDYNVIVESNPWLAYSKNEGEKEKFLLIYSGWSERRLVWVGEEKVLGLRRMAFKMSSPVQ
jgi:hypothetical protein